MKKQSDMHSPHRIPETEKQITTFPAPAFTISKPRGVQDHTQGVHAPGSHSGSARNMDGRVDRMEDRKTSARAGKTNTRSGSRHSV
ncbi:MAG TPA: hypothetical protein VL991_10425 [Terracidiphilus sp.]|nr:hypothetical protein [Terracidiphilus sp.]